MRVLRHSGAALAALGVAPLALAGLALRPGWRPGLADRLGGGPESAPGSIWVHGASVGEIRAAERLVDRLVEAGHRVVASTMTLTGREVMRGDRPHVPCRLAPLDHPWSVDRALDRVRPAALVLVETELWPTWIAAADRRDIPVVLVSGRLSDRSFPRYRRLAPLLARTLGRLRAIGARTEADRDRFVTLGADPSRVTVTGDLKLETGVGVPDLAPDLVRVLGKAPLFVAGSTHPGEEQAALAALARVERADLEATLVLAPRRPERVVEVVRIARESGRPTRRRTALGEAPLAAGEVLVLDTLGELSGLLARADVAFVGGTLAAVGGHNVLEPVLGRRPVLYGPHTANVRHAVEILESCGAGRRVADAPDLGALVAAWLADPHATDARGEAGFQALLRHQGSARRAADLVEQVLGTKEA